jgi:hypothetical protein
MADAAMFETALTSREVVRVASADTVGHDPVLMGYCMGVTNRTLVPPFAPRGRNEEGVFAAVLQLCEPDTLFGQPAVGVVHDSDRKGPYPIEPQSATETRLADLLVAFLRRAALKQRGTAEERLRHIGRTLTEISQMSARDFQRECTNALADIWCRELSGAATLCRLPTCGTHWQQAVSRYRRRFLDAVTRDTFLVPVEMLDMGRRESCLVAAQRWIGDFAELLALWPSLWASGDLKDA